MSTPIARSRSIALLACLLFFASLASPAVAAMSPTAPPQEPALGAEERALWRLVADAREATGLPPLTIDGPIIALAREQSDDMATRHYFSHYSPDGTTFLDLMPAYGIAGRFAGETLQENNFPQSAVEAARALVASPAHRAILFDPRFTIAGVGHAVGADGMHYFTIIVVQP